MTRIYGGYQALTEPSILIDSEVHVLQIHAVTDFRPGTPASFKPTRRATQLNRLAQPLPATTRQAKWFPASESDAVMAEDWLAGSIVGRRGVGWAGKPRLHDLTEALQGKYHYTIGPYSDPVLTVRPGDRIRIETRDAFEGAIKTEQDKPTEKLRMPLMARRCAGPLTSGAARLRSIWFRPSPQAGVLCSVRSRWRKNPTRS
jgi:hypothetical protein